MYRDITGIILAGGKSTRMGVDKSLLKIGNQTIIERITKLMLELFSEVTIITNNLESYSFVNIPLHMDIYKNVGPIAGIHSGLVNSKTEKNFIISCDIPLMTKEVIQFIIEYPTQKQIVVTKADGFVQQLCGTYSKKVIPTIEKNISEDIDIENRHPDQKRRGCKVLRLVNQLDSEIIDIENELKNYVPGTFFNMNNPSEYEFIRQRLEGV